MRIDRATIVVGDGTDMCILHTNLPEACYPYNGNLTLDFRAAQATGHKFVKEHFGLIDAQIEIVNRVKHSIPYSEKTK